MAGKAGKLTLIPTPIDEENPLEQIAFNLLENAALNEKIKSIFVVEDTKPGRRRWIKFGLPREIVESFILLNEHNYSEVSHILYGELKNGKNVFLMSDGGLPGFCDPGVDLINLCHDNKIVVTSAPMSNSISLAIALSGFNNDSFLFEGFISRDKTLREKKIDQIIANRLTTVLMDTPYRMKRLLEEVNLLMTKKNIKRRVFLGMDLNSPSECLLRGDIKNILKNITDFKREFILIIE